MKSEGTTDFGRQICDVLSATQAPVVAAVWGQSSGTKELRVHVAACPDRFRLKRDILGRLATVGVSRAKVRFHKASKLLAPRSLERLVARFAGDFAGENVAYDPTDAISRSLSLVRASHALRTTLTDRVRGFYFAPRLRSFYVVLDAKRIATGDKFRIGELANIERAVVEALSNAFTHQLAQCPAVRVGFGLPTVDLVPVDHRSVIDWNQRVAHAVRRYWKPVAVAALFGFGGAATASAEGPAVSQTNLKVTGLTGSVESQDAWFVNGALTAPLGTSWGLQAEAGGANIDGDSTLGAAGHLFTRDPDSYLLGIFAAYASEDRFDLDATRLGAEAELYLSQVSILAKVGYQFSDSIKDGAFGEIELRWYLSDNFAVNGGGSFEEDTSFMRFGAEWQPGFSALPGLAFRLDSAFGEDDFDSLTGGITYYFGTDASLKDRHRRQDPESALFVLFQSVQQEKSRLCAYGGNC